MRERAFEPDAGTILFDGDDLLALPPRELRRARRRCWTRKTCSKSDSGCTAKERACSSSTIARNIFCKLSTFSRSSFSQVTRLS